VRRCFLTDLADLASEALLLLNSDRSLALCFLFLAIPLTDLSSRLALLLPTTVVGFLSFLGVFFLGVFFSTFLARSLAPAPTRVGIIKGTGIVYFLLVGLARGLALGLALGLAFILRFALALALAFTLAALARLSAVLPLVLVTPASRTIARTCSALRLFTVYADEFRLSTLFGTIYPLFVYA
jgi:hypothetical protein